MLHGMMRTTPGRPEIPGIDAIARVRVTDMFVASSLLTL
jgi:hypothetical protein